VGEMLTINVQMCLRYQRCRDGMLPKLYVNIIYMYSIPSSIYLIYNATYRGLLSRELNRLSK